METTDSPRDPNEADALLGALVRQVMNLTTRVQELESSLDIAPEARTKSFEHGVDLRNTPGSGWQPFDERTTAA